MCLLFGNESREVKMKLKSELRSVISIKLILISRQFHRIIKSIVWNKRENIISCKPLWSITFGISTQVVFEFSGDECGSFHCIASYKLIIDIANPSSFLQFPVTAILAMQPLYIFVCIIVVIRKINKSWQLSWSVLYSRRIIIRLGHEIVCVRVCYINLHA